MKKSLLIYFIFCSFIFGQNNFELLYPKPSDSQNNKITFSDENSGFIINSNRQLLTTIDKGETWEIKQTLDFFPRDIKFRNNVGFITGDGTILRSDDYGKNWTKVYQYGFSFNSINFIDDTTVYISGQSTLLKSFDNGLTWNNNSFISGGSAAVTVFTDQNTGHAACYNGRILKTVDAGQNWYSTSNEPAIPSDFYSINFPTKNIGFANKGHGDMLKTTDGGETWVKISDLLYYRETYAMQFFDENVGITVGRDGAIYKTQNGGSSWQWISEMPTFTYDDGYDLRSLYFFDAQKGICVGENGRIIKTENGGVNWKNYSPTYDIIDELHLVSPNQGFMKTHKGELFKMNTDENSLLKLQYPPHQSYSQKMFFVNENIGYSIGANQGSVYKTKNGGTSWVQSNNSVSLIPYESLYSISFINENVGYVSGGYNEPGLFKTTNGGNTWEKKVANSFSRMQFLDENSGYAIIAGYYSKLYKTIDGGTTWNICLSLPSYSDILFEAFDKDNVFVKNSQGDFYRTTNGGISWTQSEIPLYGFDKIKFINENVGFVADDTRIYTTPDAGQTWNLVFYNDDRYNIETLDVSGDQLFITGDGGRVLRLSVAYLSTNQFNFKKNDAKLYPNPAKNILNILSNKDILEVNVVNALGVTVSKYIKKENIDISKLNTGIYFVEIIFADKTKQVSKIIKE